MSYILSVIGAGGKTTLIHQLADLYRREGRRVLITTTTHMLVEEDTDLSCDLSVIIRKIKAQGLIMAGSPAPSHPGKMAALPGEVFQAAARTADIVLIESDGAKQHTVKIPAAHEPVIHPDTDQVVLVLGTMDLGRQLEQVVFRRELMGSIYDELPDVNTGKVSYRFLERVADYYQKRLPGYALRLLYSFRDPVDDGLSFLRMENGEYNKKNGVSLEMKLLNNSIPDFEFDPRRFIICRGGGDLATGVVHRLSSAGFHVLVLETESPAAVRRTVSFCEAVYDGETTVEEKTAVRIRSYEELLPVLASGRIPLLVDPEGQAILDLEPEVVVDAIIAKRNLGTSMDMAPCVIGLGPGFTAGEDCHAVIETSRGHDLARIIRQGSARPNTGIPGNIGGYAAERVIHAVFSGTMRNVRQIGDAVERGEVIAMISKGEGIELPVVATIPGIIRGLIRDGYPVPKGFKIADIDPRKDQQKNCHTISDKSRSIAGSVLEVVCAHYLAAKA